MTFVGHTRKRGEAAPEQVTQPPLTLPFWAQTIEVHRCDDWLVIKGMAPSWEPVSSAVTALAVGDNEYKVKDFLDFRDLAPPFNAQTSDDWKKLSRPAMEFIDAKTDQALVDYVKNYGAVLACACSDGAKIVAAQSLVVLRREQKIFAMAFELKAALGNISQKDTTDLDGAWVNYEPIRDELTNITEARLRSHEISASAYKTLIRSHDNAQRKLHDLLQKLGPKFERIRLAAMTLATLVIEAGQAPMEEYPKEIIPPDFLEPWELDVMAQHPPAWECSAFSSLTLPLQDANYWGAFSLGQSTLCTILDQFPPKLFAEGGIAQEFPASMFFGIRPCLYFMLRRYFLMGTEVLVCQHCGRSFLKESSRKYVRFCSAKCSLSKRQSEYYFDTVKKRRKEKRMEELKNKREAQPASGRKTRSHT